MIPGGLQPLARGFSTAVWGRQRAAEPPRVGWHPPSPLRALAWRPGIPAHSPELSSAGQPCWGLRGRTSCRPPPRNQASPHRCPPAPYMVPLLGASWGYRGQAKVLLWIGPHPICCQCAGLGDGMGLAAAPAWAQGI